MTSATDPMQLCWPPRERGPHEWGERHRSTRRDFPGVRDRRIPPFLHRLAVEVAALRATLEAMRAALVGHGEGAGALMDRFLVEGRGPDGPDPEGAFPRLLEDFFSRSDWREMDILEMILDFLRASRAVYGQGLARELESLKGLALEDPGAYDQAVKGLVCEARGAVMGLGWARRRIACREPSFSGLDGQAFQAFHNVFAGMMGAVPDTADPGALEAKTPEMLWRELRRAAPLFQRGQKGGFPLKSYEKASLYLMEALPLGRPGHASFVRTLIEDDGAYTRLLATAYASDAARAEVLREETLRHNRLPECAAAPVTYSEREVPWWFRMFFLRPDVVDAIVDRERRKGVYRVLSGLGPRAFLPRVLHEVHNIFGYVTPEAFEAIVACLGLDPVDVIRVIASYKQFSADPRGDILVYVCKGTACFLRGQPELSRRLSEDVGAGPEEVGRHGVQFIEMDCFGVCHLAPVVRVQQRFLGKQRAEDIPALLERLLQGPSFDNRLSFLNRVAEVLAPGQRMELPEAFSLCWILEEGGAGVPPGAEGPDLGREASVVMGASGEVSVRVGDTVRPLGRIVPRALGFTYRHPGGLPCRGAVVLDETDRVDSVLGYRDLEADLSGTFKPRAGVAAGRVWIQRNGTRYFLGDYTDAVLVLEQDGAYRLALLGGGASGANPPEKARTWTEERADESQPNPALQDRLVLGFGEAANPESIESYLACGGYEAVSRVLGLDGGARWEDRDIIREVSASKLRGRGGAGFPAGRKWEAVRLARCVVQDHDECKEALKLIVANGDEGDPGAFMDRTLIQERPHQVLEGMILAALATGARYGIIYVRKEYEDAVRRLEHALFQARRKRFLGENIFGVDRLHFDVEIRLGAGAFVAGEKRAIMRAIEGKPAEPTFNAPSNTLRGLWGKPTLLNNVETFACVPLILRKGGRWFAEQGTAASGGTKIFSVAGIVKRTGLVEVRFGRTLNDVIEICGGIQDGKTVAGVQIGGPSGAILSLTGARSYLRHTPLDFDTFDQAGAMLGSGGLVFIGEDDDVVRLARHFTDWLSEESCGQCPACFRGTAALGETLDVVLQGDAGSDHIHRLWTQSDLIKAGSQCGLGTTAANPVTSALRFFPHAFLHYLLQNPALDRIECFRTLEALRLLTREPIEKIAGRRREHIGHAFLLKRHLVRHLVAELERLDRYRPPGRRVARRFVDLLQIEPHEVGLRDVGMECPTAA